MKRIRLAAGAAAATTAVLAVSQVAGADAGQSAAPSGAHPAQPCSVAHDAGLFGFVGSGTVLPSNQVGLPAGPFESSGIIDLLPDGTFHTTHQTLSVNGVASHISQTGTWNVTPDCAIAVTVIQGATRATVEGAMLVDGQEIV